MKALILLVALALSPIAMAADSATVAGNQGVVIERVTKVDRRAEKLLERRVLRHAYGPKTQIRRTRNGPLKDRNHAHGAGHQIVLWIPNRILDFFDMVRLRIRIGPGVSFGIRATEAADFFLGAHFTGWFGLPGPRNRRLPKLPFGMEASAGFEFSFIDLAPDIWLMRPDYGFYEGGFDMQIMVVGIAFGIDPYEVGDFFSGIVFYDAADDDL